MVAFRNKISSGFRDLQMPVIATPRGNLTYLYIIVIVFRDKYYKSCR